MPRNTAIAISEGLSDYAEAARRIGVTTRWLEDRVQRRLVPHRRLGRFVRFSEQDIDDIIEAASVRPQPRGRGAA